MPATIRKENALSASYIRILRIFLLSLGVWPSEALKENVYFLAQCQGYHMMIMLPTALMGMCHYLINNSMNLDFVTKAICYLASFMTLLIIYRTYWARFSSFGAVTRNFLMSFHLFYFKHKGEYHKLMYTKMEKMSHYFVVFGSILLILSSIFFNLPAAYSNYKNGVFTGKGVPNSTIKFSLSYSFPGIETSDYFIVVSMYNLFITYIIAFIVCGIDSLLSTMVFQIYGHIQILRNSLDTLPKPKVRNIIEFIKANGDTCYAFSEMYDTEENKIIHGKLVECIEHHKFIIRFTAKISDCFGFPIAVNYSFQLTGCCILVFGCSQGDVQTCVALGSVLVATLAELTGISLVFESVTTASEKLIDSVYAVPWECMNTSNRRTVCIMLHRMQTPIRIKVLGTTPVGVTTMASILKTSFSYINLLRSMDK